MTTGITAEMLDGGLAEDLAAASLAMARRFARGATLWCVAAGWEPHAHHMAVEFVHPVIVGKRALPAFALTGSGLAPRARVAVRPGDILMAVDPMAPATGGFVLLHHLLWELTHVCFEHPALLRPEPERADDACITCGDEGRLAEVVGRADEPDPPGLGRFGSRALVRTAAGEETIGVTLVAPVSVGDLVLVHAGAALTRPGGA